ncbi:DAK2 domain-containing protein [Bacillus sp. AGMB 02131]|uniref:DAK2 domain-containing protein n=1 Tax=Peribacillus faecalis TaxID=2772559 RepID=A0A927CSL5_9BACI|nr:DAK2 domain-containing protein [Peribacillus faecalis]MBD3106768.1 DAK2 domain-containing protein [Peribacillus faecalis]
MSITNLEGKRFAEMVLMGANQLSVNAKLVDALNVFPVPDGDTGTNMNLSMTSGAKEVETHINEHIGKVGQALSKGLLMGARGNSGVILSQLFRGFSKKIESKASINSVEFAEAFSAGVETAYKAVMKPVEGTILTVAKDAAKAAVASAEVNTDIVAVMEDIVKEANASLQRTPDLLPVLKEVGVVDSGGQGLVFVYEGFLAQLKGEKVSLSATAPSMDQLVSAEHHMNVADHISSEDITFGFCTEIMVRFKDGMEPYNEDAFRNHLSELGDSLLVISDDEVVKVHVHTEQPGEVLNYGQKFGTLIKIKVDNMREQHSSLVSNDAPSVSSTPAPSKKKEEYGIVTVAMGSGVADLFRSIGAKAVIEGGQTMNPSTEDIVKAIKEVNAKNVIILPNNKNIIMAAQQSVDLVDENVIVIPSKTVPQGMASLLAFNPSLSPEDNESAMTESLSTVKTGQITFAVRDTNIDGLEIENGDFMGIAEGKILNTSKDKLEATKELLDEMIDDDSEILTIIYGEDVNESEVNELVEYCEEKFEDVEVELHDGKQPLYSFILAVE